MIVAHTECFKTRTQSTESPREATTYICTFAHLSDLMWFIFMPSLQHFPLHYKFSHTNLWCTMLKQRKNIFLFLQRYLMFVLKSQMQWNWTGTHRPNSNVFLVQVKMKEKSKTENNFNAMEKLRSTHNKDENC